MRTLIIDDDADLRDFFSDVARACGQTDIDAVTTGEEALTHVIRKEYDLVTLDIHMPGVSGLEVLPLLRTMCPHAIIALVSGHVPEETSPDTITSADVVLTKPVRVGTFKTLLTNTERVKEILAETRQLGEPISVHTEAEVVAA